MLLPASTEVIYFVRPGGHITLDNKTTKYLIFRLIELILELNQLKT